MKVLTLILFFSSPTSLFAKDADVKYTAHRGASHLAPENTLAAFKLAFSLGADAIEGDFRLTKDNQVVCIHDKTTKRTSDKSLSIEDSTLKQLSQLDAGSWKDSKWKEERIPTLLQVLEVVPENKQIFIEIKSDSKIVPFIKDILSNAKLKTGQIIFIAFDKEVVLACKKHLPKYKTYWLVSFKKNKLTQKWKPTKAAVLKTLATLKADGLDCKAEPNVVDALFVKALRDVNLDFHVWTVNDEKTARYFKNLGVDSLTTNRPKFLKEAIEHSKH